MDEIFVVEVLTIVLVDAFLAAEQRCKVKVEN